MAAPRTIAMMPLLAVIILVAGASPAGSFHVESLQCASRHVFRVGRAPHPLRKIPRLHSSASANSSGNASIAKPTKRKSSKETQPTARFVAVAALASAGAGAQVNAGSFATRQLENDEHYKSLDERDRAFARLLLATVERRSGQIDKILKCCIKKYPPKGKNSHLIQATLRAGVAQLVFLGTPAFAAAKETVQVLRMHPNNIPEPQIKFVNGVLRNLARPPGNDAEDANEPLWQNLLSHKTSPQDNIAHWLLKRWRRDWGEEKTKMICEEMMPPEETLVKPRIDLSTKYSLGAISGMNESNVELQKLVSNMGDASILLPQGSIRVCPSLRGDVKNWPGYNEGTWWVQDASSTLPALVLAGALYDRYSQDERSDIHIVDMCAAPGGKTSQLLSAGFGHVTAIEASSRRSRRLIENLSRLGLAEKCEVVVEKGQDWVPPSDDQCVHGLLLDVPCSATGTGAKRPDVLRRSSDLNELLQTQAFLANHCADNILNVGGVLVYATCSILKEESEDQVQKLVERGNVETLPILAHEVPGFEDAIDDNGWLRVLPGILGGELQSTDGFFVARLIKK